MNEHEHTDLERGDDAPDAAVTPDEANPYERTDLDWGARTDLYELGVLWRHRGGFNTDSENAYHYSLRDSAVRIPGASIQDPVTGYWHTPNTVTLRGDGTWDLVEFAIQEKREPARVAETEPHLYRNVLWRITDQARPAVRLDSRDELDLNDIGEWYVGKNGLALTEASREHRPWDTNWMTDEWGAERGLPYVIGSNVWGGSRVGDGRWHVRGFVEVRDVDRDGVWDTIRLDDVEVPGPEHIPGRTPFIPGMYVSRPTNWDIEHLDIEVEELAYRPSAADTDAYIINVLRELVPSDAGVEWSDEDGLKTVTQDFLETAVQIHEGRVRGHFDDAWPTSLAVEPEPEPTGPQTIAFDYYIPGPASNFALYYLGKVFDQAAAATDTDGRFPLHYGNFFASSPHVRDLALLMFGSPVYEESLDNHRLPPLMPARHRVDLQDVEPAVDSKGTRIVVQKEINNELVEVAQTLDFVHDSVDEVEQKVALITDALADPALGAPFERVTRVYGDQHTKGDGVTIVLNIFGVSEMPSVLPDALAYIGEGSDPWGW